MEEADNKKSNATESTRIDTIRSDEVQEILSYVPNWMIRWGMSLLFCLIFLLVFLSWFIKYPDVILGKITITTELPPVKLVSKTSGQIQEIFIEENELVNKGQYIAEIQNPLNKETIEYLEKIVLLIDTLLPGEQSEERLASLSFKDSNLVFGELQAEYNRMKLSVIEYQQLLSNKFRENNIENIEKQLEYYKSLAIISDRQLNLFEKKSKGYEEKYQSDKRLYAQGVISKMDFFIKENEYTTYLQEIENLKKTVVQNNITISEYENQLAQLTYKYNEEARKLRAAIIISIDNLKNFIYSWQQNYVLTAPFSGELSYLSNLHENQFINAGVPLFAVIPENNKYVGQVQISSLGFGKVKVGQKVHIKLDNYPYHQFGQLNGEIAEITPIPSADASGAQLVYLAKVKLIENLKTTYNKDLDFKPEMTGSAEIITEDLRLIQRIFSQFRTVFDNE